MSGFFVLFFGKFVFFFGKITFDYNQGQHRMFLPKRKIQTDQEGSLSDFLNRFYLLNAEIEHQEETIKIICYDNESIKDSIAVYNEYKTEIDCRIILENRVNGSQLILSHTKKKDKWLQTLISQIANLLMQIAVKCFLHCSI